MFTNAAPIVHVEIIKATLRINGTSCAAIAQRLHVTRTAVSMVIHRKSASRRIQRAVANALQMPVAAVFPRPETERETEQEPR